MKEETETETEMENLRGFMDSGCTKIALAFLQRQICAYGIDDPLTWLNGAMNSTRITSEPMRTIARPNAFHQYALRFVCRVT